MAEVSLPALALRLAISMGVVIGLMLIASRLLKRAQTWALDSSARPGRRDRPAGDPGGDPASTRRARRGRVTRTPIAITTIAPLTRSASVALVRTAGRELVLGVTETQVTLLHSGVDPDATPDDAVGMDLDHDLALLLGGTQDDLPVTTPTTSTAARIAAVDVGTPSRGPGLPAWTDALETLRAMTARR